MIQPGANQQMEVPQAFHRAAVGCRGQIIAEISFSASTSSFDTGTLPCHGDHAERQDVHIYIYIYGGGLLFTQNFTNLAESVSQ